MPERLRTLSSVNDQMIFSSLGADPLANPMLVMAEPSTIRRLRLGNSSLLNLIWLSTQAFSFRIRQRTYRILANIFSSGRASTPERDCMPSVEHKMIFSSLWAPPSNKMSVMLEPSTRKHLRFLNSSFLKVRLSSMYAFSRSLRQTILGSWLRTFRLSCFSRVPVRVIFASWKKSLSLVSS
uniref:Uncharacterized protein n=1 Tax=Triticum urartu TaxID=4572 RepID=A0A8R7UZD1_TRIUA